MVNLKQSTELKLLDILKKKKLNHHCLRLKEDGTRKKLGFKIGEPKFAMAQYDKINRITIPLGNEGIILVTTELDVDIGKIVDGIIETRTGFFG